MDLTADRLRELLSYEPDTGIFRWLESRGRVMAGAIAGSPNNYGYLTIGVDGRQYLAHRLAWLWSFGEWPISEIDHRNRKPADNRLSNLRQATRSQNNRNCSGHRSSVSQKKGVSFDKTNNKWIAKIRAGGRNRRLGCFATAEMAAAAYDKAAIEHFGEFAHINGTEP